MAIADERAVTIQPAEPGGIMRRLNMWTGIVCGLVVGAIAWFLAHHFIHTPWGSDATTNITFAGWGVGFMIGIGAFVGPVRWMDGRDLTLEDDQYLAGHGQGWRRYLKFCTDHKVVGVQYLVVGLVMFAVGGVMAMIIRTELIRPGAHFVTTQQYNAIVGLHGIIMILALATIVTGTFGNFIMPLMIGARDMAFPRLNALSF